MKKLILSFIFLSIALSTLAQSTGIGVGGGGAKGGIRTTATDPTVLKAGDFWFNSTVPAFKFYTTGGFKFDILGVNPSNHITSRIPIFGASTGNEIVSISNLFVTNTTLIAQGTSGYPGFGLGTVAGDPTTTANGDMWYNSITGKFRVRQGGANTDMVGGGSSAVVTTQSGTTYTLVAGDANSYIEFTNASPITVTLPNGLASNFFATLVKKGAGNITITATTTLESDGVTIEVQHAGAVVYHKGSNVWTALGSLGAPLTLANITGTLAATSVTGGNVDVNFYEQADFTSNVNGSEMGLFGVSVGAGAVYTVSTYGVNTTENAFGVNDLTTGTTATGETHIYKGGGGGTNSLFFGGHALILKFRIAPQVLSDGTDTYSCTWGFGEQLGIKDQTNGAYFTYTHGTNAGKWQAVTASAATRTTTDTGVAAVTTFSIFEIRVNQAGTSVTFYIDGTLVATNTTNIPTATTGVLGQIVKSLGTTSRKLSIDWASLNVTRTTAR